jgi:hypothetical protein
MQGARSIGVAVTAIVVRQPTTPTGEPAALVRLQYDEARVGIRPRRLQQKVHRHGYVGARLEADEAAQALSTPTHEPMQAKNSRRCSNSMLSTGISAEFITFSSESG